MFLIKFSNIIEGNHISLEVFKKLILLNAFLEL